MQVPLGLSGNENVVCGYETLACDVPETETDGLTLCRRQW